MNVLFTDGNKWLLLTQPIMSTSGVQIWPHAQLTMSTPYTTSLTKNSINRFMIFGDLRKKKLSFEKVLIKLACCNVNIYSITVIVSSNVKCLDEWLSSSAHPVEKPFLSEASVWRQNCLCHADNQMLPSTTHQREIAKAGQLKWCVLAVNPETQQLMTNWNDDLRVHCR